jgi:hypothetical protein
MFKKVFALASFTALTGVIALGTAAGCSSSTTSSSTEDTDGSTVKKDASSDRSTTPVDDDAGPTTCPSSDPVAASDLPWAPPTATQPGLCQEKDLTAFQDWLKANTSATNDQFMQYIKTEAGDNCYNCIFTDASKSTWGPIPISGGKLVTINVGACFALASGNTGCGQAIQNEFDCEFVACADCADDTSFQSCQKKAQTGACKPFVQAIQSGCSGVPATVDDVCGSFIDTIRIQCVTANVFDGGTDP